MNGLLHNWIFSFIALRPQSLGRFLFRGLVNFKFGFVSFLKIFPWVLILDIGFVGTMGPDVINFMACALRGEQVNIKLFSVLALLVIGITTFLMQLLFILFLRREHFLLNPKVYIQTYLLRYVQFVFAIMFFSTSLRMLLLMGGMFKMPPLPELVLFLVKAFEVFALFFWLDSNHSFKALFRSFERAANLLVYTLPFVFFVSLISFGALALLVGSIVGWDKVFQIPYALASFIEFFIVLNRTPTVIQLLLIKYGRFIIDGIVVSLLYTWYKRKRATVFAAQLLEG